MDAAARDVLAVLARTRPPAHPPIDPMNTTQKENHHDHRQVEEAR